jgi:hypothetical protein
MAPARGKVAARLVGIRRSEGASAAPIRFGGDAGGGLLTEPDVAAQARQVLVAGFGLQLGGGAAVDG